MNHNGGDVGLGVMRLGFENGGQIGKTKIGWGIVSISRFQEEGNFFLKLKNLFEEVDLGWKVIFLIKKGHRKRGNFEVYDGLWIFRHWKNRFNVASWQPTAGVKREALKQF